MHEKRRERGRTYRVGLILGFCLLIAVNGLFPVSCVYAEEEQTKIAYGENTPGQLYARSAVLMDADSGRILFAKNAETERPMASTTKIMTCILALERADPDESVSVSANAAAQPRVRLGTVEGQKFKLKDLLYSLMLESHNDTAVMLAEHLAGSVEQFADEMNQKARELGLSHTHFVTPNGLDSSDITLTRVPPMITFVAGVFARPARISSFRFSTVVLSILLNPPVVLSNKKDTPARG